MPQPTAYADALGHYLYRLPIPTRTGRQRSGNAIETDSALASAVKRVLCGTRSSFKVIYTDTGAAVRNRRRRARVVAVGELSGVLELDGAGAWRSGGATLGLWPVVIGL